MPPEKRYVVKQPDGGLIGPVGLGAAKDLISAGLVGGEAMVARGGEPFMPVWRLPEFAALVQKNTKPLSATYTGYFSELSFYRVFSRLALARETGRLLVSQHDALKEVFLVDGRPVFVGSNLPDERIGHYLVAKGVISRANLDDALVIVGDFGNQLGKTLMTMQLISPHAFYEHLVAQLRDKIAAMCTWTDGRYDYYKGILYDGAKVPVELEPFDIMRQAADLSLDPDIVRARLGARIDHLVEHHAPLAGRVSVLKLYPFEQAIYAAARGRTPRDLAHEFVGSDNGASALKLCYLLLEFGFLVPSRTT
jgi:hypothetical protein